MTENPPKISVLFVCMGNICRSPTAEGVFRHVVHESGLADLIRVDSAGTHAYHVGEPPDRRAQAAAERRGFTLADIRARRVRETDYAEFDYVIAMDRLNLHMLTEQAGGEYHERLSLFLEHGSSDELEVPDPYYGGSAGFERVLDLVEEASRRLLETLRSRHSI
ncbi:MAG: low molecular weight phosphotyrosine protein phosphatase [Gammaproteobacteria bacterium]|nr:low molecular weight phosphotyrosine protein phosphatase [Gammaproteobacteria bacterium]